MTQLIISTPPTLFPSELFTHILGYCDDTIERKQKKHMKKVVNAFKEIFEVRTEEGINSISSKIELNILKNKLFQDIYPFKNKYSLPFASILITPVRLNIPQDFKEIRTCNEVTDRCNLNTYTKIGTICGYHDSDNARHLPPPLTYSHCTNY